MAENDELAPYEVFEGTAWEAGLLRSILDDNEIENIQNDRAQLPWNMFPVGSSTIKVFVAQKDFEKALKLVKEFTENMKQSAEFDPEDQTP
ncbi:MAG: DUF2007 domain-containing protein [Bacteroidetes bacterium]|nr:DUF2007 domain-containing protein [Bacteroidota bacterium]